MSLCIDENSLTRGFTSVVGDSWWKPWILTTVFYFQIIQFYIILIVWWTCYGTQYHLAKLLSLFEQLWIVFKQYWIHHRTMLNRISVTAFKQIIDIWNDHFKAFYNYIYDNRIIHSLWSCLIRVFDFILAVKTRCLSFAINIMSPEIRWDV